MRPWDDAFAQPPNDRFDATDKMCAIGNRRTLTLT